MYYFSWLQQEKNLSNTDNFCFHFFNFRLKTESNALQNFQSFAEMDELIKNGSMTFIFSAHAEIIENYALMGPIYVIESIEI